jgi:hypothetical protein
MATIPPQRPKSNTTLNTNVAVMADRLERVTSDVNKLDTRLTGELTAVGERVEEQQRVGAELLRAASLVEERLEGNKSRIVAIEHARAEDEKRRQSELLEKARQKATEFRWRVTVVITLIGVFVTAGIAIWSRLSGT